MKLKDQRIAFLKPWPPSSNGNETILVQGYTGTPRYTVRPYDGGVRIVVSQRNQRHDVIFVGFSIPEAKAWLWLDHMGEPTDVEDLDTMADYKSNVTTVRKGQV